MNKKIHLFGLAVLLQVVLLLFIPIPRWLALTSGRTVVLETAPVDPYTVFQGYYARLGYRISTESNLPFEKSSIKPVDGKYYYVVLSPAANGIWEPQRVLEQMPDARAHKLPSNEVALKGRYRGWGMEYGIEQYYLPENKRQELENLLRDQSQKILVTVKVGAGGQGAIVKLAAGGEEFKY